MKARWESPGGVPKVMCKLVPVRRGSVKDDAPGCVSSHGETRVSTGAVSIKPEGGETLSTDASSFLERHSWHGARVENQVQEVNRGWVDCIRTIHPVRIVDGEGLNGNIVLITQSLEGGTAKEPMASGLVGSAPWAGRCNVWTPHCLGSRGLEGARDVPSQNFLIRRAKCGQQPRSSGDIRNRC